MNERGRIALAEGIGTLILVVGGPGTAMLATGTFLPKGTVGVLGVALAFGLSLLCAAYAIGSISGLPHQPGGDARALGDRQDRRPADVPFYLGRPGHRRHRRRRRSSSSSPTASAASAPRRPASRRTATARTRRARANGGPCSGLRPGSHPRRDRVHRAVRLRDREHEPEVDVGRLHRPRRRAHADAGPPHHDPDRQHVGEPGAQPRDRGLPGHAGRSSSSGCSSCSRSSAALIGGAGLARRSSRADDA